LSYLHKVGFPQLTSNPTYYIICVDRQVNRYMGTIIRDEKLIKIAENVKPDAKRRVYLPKVLLKQGISYHIYTNSIGQIILDPQVSISASEAWLFENQSALASVDKGMTESANCRVKDRGSFAGYTRDAL
jgi:hypothetical protein